MNTFPQILEAQIIQALQDLSITTPENFSIKVTTSNDLRHGDYQCNAALALAKSIGKNPRELAQEIITALNADELAEISIAGPGFINFRILTSSWDKRISTIFDDPRLGVPTLPARNIVLDFSAPNIAKPMHVGHIRSTIIGDSLARIATFLGHNVTRDNHIGDWGTQFGMIIYGWKNLLDPKYLKQNPLSELLRIYRAVNALCKEDEFIKESCKIELVKLQGGDAENTSIWNECVTVSKAGLERIYQRLDVSFDYWLGESFYNDALAPLTDQLQHNELAKESNGALCVFSSGSSEPKQDPFKEKRNDEWCDLPMIVRKKDGAFNYATTDIATIDYRIDTWNAQEIWYVVDARQSLHFRQLFDIAKRRNCAAKLEHISFGTILGENGQPLKTRDGDLPQLEDVLNDAVKSARTVLEEKSKDLSNREKDDLAEIIGLGAIKFTELSHHRSSDYMFDLENMVALQGDTAPYLQYSYVRTRSIFRKMDENQPLPTSSDIRLSEEAEIHLARTLSHFSEILPTVLEGFKPNILSSYLLELARAFHSFFEQCPVLKSEDQTRLSRLALCKLTGDTLSLGLSLFGIQIPEKM